MMQELVKKSRSYRRFQQDRAVTRETLVSLVELARFAPSAKNMQPLKYLLSHTREKNDVIFPCLTWAALLKEWPGPAEGEKPAAYVIILGDTEIAETIRWDDSIAAQTIMLGAVDQGLRGCILAAIDRKRLTEGLKIPKQYRIMLAVALGYPHETVVIDEMKDGAYHYWRDEKDWHHVPKRTLQELLLDL